MKRGLILKTLFNLRNIEINGVVQIGDFIIAVSGISCAIFGFQ